MIVYECNMGIFLHSRRNRREADGSLDCSSRRWVMCQSRFFIPLFCFRFQDFFFFVS